MSRSGVGSVKWGYGSGIGAVTLVVALALFSPVFKWMAFEFTLPRNDLSHGWLIPPVALYFIWRRRKELYQAVLKPDWRGVVAVLFGLAFFWLGCRGGQLRLSQVAMIWELWAIPFALYGSRVARLMVFPAAYLCFCIPLGFLDFFTVPLRLFTVRSTAVLLNGLGIAVLREGTGLRSLQGPGFNLDIADPCSGLRSLYALGAVTAAYACVTLRGLLRQWVLFISAVPLAVIGNSVRILTIMLVANFCGMGTATAYYHDYSGWVVFIVALLLMFRLGGWLERRPLRDFEHYLEDWWSGTSVREEASGVRLWQLADRVKATLVPLSLCIVLVVQFTLPPPQLDDADFIELQLPATVAGCYGDAPLYCHNEQCLMRVMSADLSMADGEQVCPACGGRLFHVSLGEATKLPVDTQQAKQLYCGGDGLEIDLSLVLSGGSRMSIHRPELCIPSQVFRMSRVKKMSLPLPGRGPLPIHMVQVGKSDYNFVLCYWFVSRNYETASHTVRILRDAWSRSVHNRISRWAMYVVVVNRGIDDPATTDIITEVAAEIYRSNSDKGGDNSGNI